jgi:pimeloyl-ACP methyl ester carboxylesterase
MPEITIRERAIGYASAPKEFDPARPAVLFIHGTGGDRTDWKAQLDKLSDTANMLAVELPGHGASDGPGERDVGAFSQWVIDFVDVLGLEQVMLVGNSLGSAVAQWIALEDRPWLKALGLVGAGCRLRVHPALLEGLLTDKEKALSLLGEFALGSDPDESLKQELSEKFRNCSPELIHGDLTACNEFDVTDRISAITLPTFIAVGEEDRLTPVKYSQFLDDRIPNTRLCIIPGAGHLVMTEQPNEFNRRLEAFMKDTDFIS